MEDKRVVEEQDMAQKKQIFSEVVEWLTILEEKDQVKVYQKNLNLGS
jgi:hypothetical protein